MMNNQDPPLCANGCGFFGNPMTQNLCSKCYNDALKQKMQKSFEVELERAVGCLTIASPIRDQPDATTATNTNNDDNGIADEKAAKKKTDRCEMCKKRVGLPGFTCKCGGVFCGNHRYPEEHSCAVDCKGYQRKILSNALHAGAVKADKLDYRL